MSLREAIEAEQARQDAERAARMPASVEPFYDRCPNCSRQRLFLRMDGKMECEKCEAVFLPDGDREW